MKRRTLALALLLVASSLGATTERKNLSELATCTNANRGDTYIVTDSASPYGCSETGRYEATCQCRDGKWSALVDAKQAEAVPAQNEWNVWPAPVISDGTLPTSNGSCSPQFCNWNDPWLMTSGCQAGDTLCMYASRGTNGGGDDVRVYYLSSTNGGKTWTVGNSGNPVISKGTSGQFDDYGIEAPAICKLGSTWHAYYTYYLRTTTPPYDGIFYGMGHASSTDGLTFTGHASLSISSVVASNTAAVISAGNPWGSVSVAEAACATVGSTIYLYYNVAHCRSDSCAAMVPSGERAVALATTTDGTTMTAVGPVLLQDPLFPPRNGWDGPYPSGVLYHATLLGSYPFRLFVGQRRQLASFLGSSSGSRNETQALVEYQSADGLKWQERSVMLTPQVGEWNSSSVRAPSCVLTGGQVLCAYAGDSYKGVAPDGNPPSNFEAGIGMMSRYLHESSP